MPPNKQKIRSRIGTLMRVMPCSLVPQASPSTKKPAASKGKVGAAKGKASPTKKAAAPTWTPEQIAAGTKIQAHIRGHLGRKRFRY